MMKSAFDWFLGKSEISITNDLNPVPVSIGSEREISSNDKDSSKENNILNGHFSGGTPNRNISHSSPAENPNRSSGEEARSPWGRTLTPKSSKYASQINQNSSPSRISPHGSSLRMSPPMSWEDMSFTSDVISPGFASRIAKEARGGRKMYDGSRRYPMGQEKYIRAGVLPNVRLKGRSKPVVMPRRAPTSPLIPLTSSSPFSSSSMASGFLASASTRMPDISSVVSVLDSTPSTSGYESIKDPTSVQAVVAALEQAQNLKSGIKRSRYGETEDSNKKQKCTINSSLEKMNDFASPVTTQAFSSNNAGGGGGAGGEKRALDISPSNSIGGTPEEPQLSPENKRRCIPNPRIASFSSSKNFNNFTPNHNSSGRETPFSMYESHQDSDSESNKSMESHQSKQSERSFRVQNHDVPSGRISCEENFDRSGSQTPQSVRGSYGIAASNGSNSSSRTTTPSKPSHIFSLEAYKADKAKSNQRLNKMLGILFNVADEENEGIKHITTPSNAFNNGLVAISETSSVTTVASVVTSPVSLLTTTATQSSTGLLKEAFSKVQTELTPLDDKAKECQVTENGASEVSTTYTFTLKSSKDVPEVTPDSKAKDSTLSESSSNTLFAAIPQLPSYQEATSVTASTATTVSIPSNINTSLSFPTSTTKSVPSFTLPKEPVSTTESNTSVSTSLRFPSLLNPLDSQSSSEALRTILNTTSPSTTGFNFSPSKPSIVNISNSNTSISSTLSLAKPSQSQSSVSIIDTSNINVNNVLSVNSSDSMSTNGISKPVFSFGSNTESNIAKSTSVAEGNATKPLFSFPQPSFSSGDKNTTVSSSGLFNFAVSSAPPTFNVKEKEASVNATSQSVSSPFVFGASLPSSSSTTATTAPSISKVSTPSIFNFTASQPSQPTTTNNGFSFASSQPTATTSIFSAATSGLPSVSSNITQPQTVFSNSGFSFNSSQSEAIKTTSVTTTASSVFGSNTLTFGANPFKTSVSNSLEYAQPQATSLPPTSTTAVFSFGGTTGSSSNLFSFANSTKQNQTNSSPFSFGPTTSTTTTTTSSSGATPAFGAVIGGGFSFGKGKSTTVPEFGAITTTVSSSNNSTASTFSFNSLSSKPQTGFDFANPKNDNSTAPSNLFSFGGGINAQSSPFGGTTTTTSSGGFPTTTPKTSMAFNFGSEAPSANPFNTQTPPVFGASEMANKATVNKPLFGGSNETTTTTFGSSNTVSPFNMNPSSNPFNSKPPVPTFGGFGTSKPESQTSVVSTLTSPPPNQNPFQVGQSTTQNAPFSFGSSNSSNPQIFQFGGSQGGFGASGTGSSTFGFGNSITTSGPPGGFGSSNISGGAPGGFGNSNTSVGPPGANIFVVGATTEAPSGSRRMKARSHRRR